MPHMGESVVEGKIVHWLKREGDAVKRDETIAEVETAKADVEIPAPDDAVILKILAREGETVAVGAEIALLTKSAAPGAEAAAPPKVAAELPPAPLPAAEPAAAVTERRALTITPVVAKMMERHGLGVEDLRKIRGTGAGGRVTKQDILAYVMRSTGPAPVAPGTPAPVAMTELLTAPPRPVEVPLEAPEIQTRPEEPVDEVELTPLRKAIAEHMVRSKHTAPHVTTVAEVDMTALVEFRGHHKARFQEEEGIPLTYMPFVVKAVCAALKAFPPMNASLSKEKILLRRYYHIGIAVATPAGLVVPVIRHADRLPFRQLAQALQRVAAHARERKLSPAELEGATFTISNPGVFGGVLSTPIIHQPQAAILNVQAIRKVPAVRDGALAIGSMMYLCLSYDHRIIDGAVAVQFLQAVRRDLETPLGMFV
jgi:pyruvate dehydrogenase E2 component (dihydrolipoamide acetyltransferase)